jgi:hypothetical protein
MPRMWSSLLLERAAASLLQELAVGVGDGSGLQELAAIKRLRLIHQRTTLDQLTGRVRPI